MIGFIIRRARPTDTQALTKVLADGWKRAFTGGGRKVDVALFLAETEGETVFVAERAGRILGFAAVYEPESFLHHLYVWPSVHRRGVGSALLKIARDCAREPLSLKTQAKNERAQAFYAAHGFYETERGDDGGGTWVRLQAPD